MKHKESQGQNTRKSPVVWEQTNGPYGGYIRSLLAVPDGTLYAGTELGGVFRSEDRGNSWTEVNAGLTRGKLCIPSLAVWGTTLYAGTLDGVFRSKDGGESWTQTGLTNLRILSLAVPGISPASVI